MVIVVVKSEQICFKGGMKIFCLGILSVLFILVSGCNKPEKALVGHYQKLESIMDKHMDEPQKGVEKLIAYLESNGGEMRRAEFDLTMSIAAEEKDGDRAELIKTINERTEKSRKNFAGTQEKFFKAVMKDKAAQETLADFQKRSRDARRAASFGGLLSDF